MLLFVGLGNPGPRHASNRHNIGFMAVQAIARRHNLSPWRRRFQGVAVEGTIAGERTLLLLPGTYMNESGRAVAEAAHFYKLEAGSVVVFHDEVDLPPDLAAAGDLTIDIDSPTFSPPNDRRRLGVVVHALDVWPAGARLSAPPTSAVSTAVL